MESVMGSGAYRPFRDDQEDLGVREAEETRQEVDPPRLDRIVLSLPGASRTLRSS